MTQISTRAGRKVLRLTEVEDEITIYTDSSFSGNINIIIQGILLEDEVVYNGLAGGSINIYGGIAPFIRDSDKKKIEPPIDTLLKITSTVSGDFTITENNATETLSFVSRERAYKVTLEGAGSGALVYVDFIS